MTRKPTSRREGNQRRRNRERKEPSAHQRVEDNELEERWANHYSSFHEILLVGEGDFSFSLSLANAFGSACNIVATSLDPYDTVVDKYAKAKSNLDRLARMGAAVIHGVDATKMKLHTDLKMRRFDRIVYNFPHAGFKGKENEMRLIKLHQRLVQGFFYNARSMLRPNGEVHVTHKTTDPYNRWNLEELASMNSLVLLECTDFNIKDYPGYRNKRGDGVLRDLPFKLGKCCTFMFGINEIHAKNKSQKMKAARSYGRSSIHEGTNHHPHAILYPQLDHILSHQMQFVINPDELWGQLRSPPRIRVGPVIEELTRGDHSRPRIAIGREMNYGTNYMVDVQEFYSSPRIGINSAPSRLLGYDRGYAHDLVGGFGSDFRHANRGHTRGEHDLRPRIDRLLMARETAEREWENPGLWY